MLVGELFAQSRVHIFLKLHYFGILKDDLGLSPAHAKPRLRAKQDCIGSKGIYKRFIQKQIFSLRAWVLVYL